MSLIQTPSSISDAPLDAQPALEAVNNLLGSVPNMFRIISNSPAALNGYVSLNSALGKGSLPATTRERIALTVAEVNDCNYCLAAHTYLGQNVAKLTSAEMARNRQGRSTDVKADVAVRFAKSIAENRGQVDNSLFNEVKTAGYDEAQIVEIIAHVALNTMTNYVNKILGTEIDFPTPINKPLKPIPRPGTVSPLRSAGPSPKQKRIIMRRPPLPPFTNETAAHKVRAAEDGWNTRNPEKIALAYSENSQWRNRGQFINGRAEIIAFLTDKWSVEGEYRLIKELFAHDGNRIGVRFAYEFQDADGQWFRAYGNENWIFDEDGLMAERHASINDVAIAAEDRLFHWPQGRRPDDHPSLSDLGL